MKNILQFIFCRIFHAMKSKLRHLLGYFVFDQIFWIRSRNDLCGSTSLLKMLHLMEMFTAVIYCEIVLDKCIEKYLTELQSIIS